MVGVQTRKKIADLGDGPYLIARYMAAEKGMRLAGHVLHDDYLVGSNRYQEVMRVYAARARELLVHPEKNGQFVKGQDVIDACEDNAGRQWVLPAGNVPEEAVGRQKVGLFVDPEHIEVTDKKVVIHPASVVVLDSFIQDSGTGGKVDEATRIPLEVDIELWEKLSDSEKRVLYRIDGVGVRPLVRRVSDRYNLRRDVFANDRPDDIFGVAAEVTDAINACSKLTILRRTEEELIVRGTKEQIENLIAQLCHKWDIQRKE